MLLQGRKKEAIENEEDQKKEGEAEEEICGERAPSDTPTSSRRRKGDGSWERGRRPEARLSIRYQMHGLQTQRVKIEKKKEKKKCNSRANDSCQLSPESLSSFFGN